jgi:tripartite-type tricarboxylate transporter receptor subunit TctC
MKQNAALGLLLGFMAIAIAVLSAPANGDDYPQRTVTFICPFPAGGGTDILTRMLAQELQDKLKQPFIVENRTANLEICNLQART